MSNADEADYAFLKSDQGLVVCAECGKPCAELARLRLCFHCGGWEDEGTLDRSQRSQTPPAVTPTVEAIRGEALAGLDAEELAIAIWELPEEKCA